MTDLAVLPVYREQRIIIGTSARKTLPILKHYLASLAAQKLPTNTVVEYVFVPDWPDPKDEAAVYLKDWLAERKGQLVRGLPTNAKDFSDGAGQVTHHWSGPAMQRVGEHKNRILRYAQSVRADGVFFADADLLMDPYTLWSALHVDLPLVAAVYWTRWQRTCHPDTQQPMRADPQVWLRHPYDLSGRGMEEAEFRAALVSKKLTQVWGQGACTLIRPRVWESGIDFTPLPDLPKAGMWLGEDRHFCVRMERSHLPMFADPWSDILHLYHQPEDIAKADLLAPTMLAERARISPALGDWVNLILQPMEPFPQENGQYLQVGPQYVRGRMGALPMLPELEEAVSQMVRGEHRVVAVHPGLDHPIAYMRGRRRLIRVTLIDHKPWGYPPVLSDDLHVTGTGAWREPKEAA